MSPRFRAAAVVATLAIGLSACIVVPVDPRTGRPYDTYNHHTQPSTVTVLPPSAPPAPTVLSARLYPLNAQANRSGLLTAVVVDHRGGRGSFSIGYGGETLQGEATRVDAGYAAFGRIHNEALGAAPRSFSGQRGIANGVGGRGVNVQCEYLMTGPGIGTGACVFSDGAAYQMHFGN